MPTRMLEMPVSVLDAAENIALRRNVDVVRLFAELLHDRYGVDFVAASREISAKGKKRKVDIPVEVEEISGIISLPTDAKDEDLITEYIREKHGEMR